MSAVPSYFIDFMRNIRLTESQITDCKTGYRSLQERLHSEDDLKDIIVDSFLQGSYRRYTAVRPFRDREKSDVDIVVVTTLDRNTITPRQALDRFNSFLEKYYKGKYKAHDRSWKIELSYVELDLVPTSATSRAVEELVKSTSVQNDLTLEDGPDWKLSISWQPGRLLDTNSTMEKATNDPWRKEPLWIPDREVQKWDKTHPLAQIEATQIKNSNCNGHYVNVVKCIKWWRITQRPNPQYPKSYPLEHLCWVNCSNGVNSVAAGVVSTLESIRDTYKADAMSKRTPWVADHGVPEHNVLGRVSGNDFAAFHQHITEAATLARHAYEEEDIQKSVTLWKGLFGDRFPDPPTGREGDSGESPSKPGGYTPRKEPSIIGGGRYAA